MPTDTNLQNRIDDCYTAFADYSRPRMLEAAPTRDPRALLATLTSAPLRALTPEQIGPYAGWAMTTVGGVDDYRHFLPRILELATFCHSQPGLDPPFIAGKLGYAGWPTWPPDERKAVLGLFAEAWHAGLWRHPDEVDSSGWIAAIALLGGDLDGALAAWLSTPSPNAALHLAAFFQGEAESLIRKPRNVAYWGNVDDDTIDRMQRWLRGEEPRQLLLNARGLAEPKDEWLLDSALLVVNAVTP